LGGNWGLGSCFLRQLAIELGLGAKSLDGVELVEA
jgi:hypothetical protein